MPENKEIDLFPAEMLEINGGYQKENSEPLNVMMLDKYEILHSFIDSFILFSRNSVE